MSQIVIAHLIASNFFGGPEKQVLTHARLLRRERFRFLLIPFIENSQHNELLHHALEAGIEVVELNTDSAFDVRAVFKLERVLERHNVTCLCSHGYKSNVIGRLATGIAGIPHLAVSRGWTAENRKIRVYEMMDKLFLRLAKRVVAVSEGQRQKIIRTGVDSDRVVVIHNAIALPPLHLAADGAIRLELGIPADAVFVASAGRLSPEKNHAAMIEAARIVCSSRDDIYFAVFGEGFMRQQLEERIRDAGLVGRFLLPGFRKDIEKVFSNIDIFMLPSFTEGLPNVALEAFVAKKPIVATAVGGTPEVVQDGISGFLTSPEDVSLMARHLINLAADRELRKRMGEAGYLFVSTHFGFEEQTRKYENLYAEVLR